jgi:hypothetical protein
MESPKGKILQVALVGQNFDRAPEDELLLEELEELLELELELELEVRPELELLEELELLDELLDEELLEDELELLEEGSPPQAVNKNAPMIAMQSPVMCFLMVILLSQLIKLMAVIVI